MSSMTSVIADNRVKEGSVMKRGWDRSVRVVRIPKTDWWGITNWVVGGNTGNLPQAWVQLSGFGWHVQVRWRIIMFLVPFLSFVAGVLVGRA